MTEDPIVNKIITRMVLRSKVGMIKYGLTTEDNPKPVGEWIDDAIEEALDFAIYLQRLKQELSK